MILWTCMGSHKSFFQFQKMLCSAFWFKEASHLSSSYYKTELNKLMAHSIIYKIFSNFCVHSQLFFDCFTENFNYSHLSDKRGAHAYWFKKIPPTTILELCISFFHKIQPFTFIPTSMFSDLANFVPPPRLFQPPGLLERWEWVIEFFFFFQFM